MDLNVRGVFNLTQKCAKMLEEAGVHGDPARVINIASVATLSPAKEDGPVAAWAYAASKAALWEVADRTCFSFGCFCRKGLWVTPSASP